MQFPSKGLTGAIWRGGKHVVLLGIDVAATLAAIGIAAAAEWPRVFQSVSWPHALLATALVTAAAAAIFYFMGLSRRFWRFVSIIDLSLIVASAAAVTMLLSLLLAIALGDLAPNVGFYLVQFFLASGLMSAARGLRRFGPRALALASRLSGAGASPDEPLALIAGSPDAVELVLRKRELGVLKGFRPIGVLEEGELNLRRRIHGVPVVGGLQSLNHVFRQRMNTAAAPKALVIAAGGADASDAKYVSLASRASDLGLTVIRAALTGVEGAARVELKSFDLSELLGRPLVKLDHGKTAVALGNRSIVVTGAGGSIGSELVRQIASFAPRKIVLIEQSEFNLYQIELETRQNFPETEIVPVLCDIRDRNHVMSVFLEHQPQFVFHAAALKHVPLVELNPCPAVATNLIGTRNVADASRKCHAIAMIQVSTDKAVNPIGVMGATKRLGELYCQALDLENCGDPGATRIFTVRFGNVLGSSGSVVPLFQRQLRDRLPLTVTHPDMTRFFMTIHEAVGLVLQTANAAFSRNPRCGRIFVLDMGEPIKVVDIAHRMIKLSGLEPGVDAKVKFIGTRPGEKLFEQLFDKSERRLQSEIAGIFEAEASPVPLATLNEMFARLTAAVAKSDETSVRKEIFALIADEGEDRVGMETAMTPDSASASQASNALETISGTV